MNEQIKGLLDRAATVVATWFVSWLVAHKMISESDSVQLLPLLIMLPAMAYAWWNNSRTRQLQKAAAVVGDHGETTVVLAAPSLADATKESNIISVKASSEVIHQAIEQAKP